MCTASSSTPATNEANGCTAAIETSRDAVVDKLKELARKLLEAGREMNLLKVRYYIVDACVLQACGEMLISHLKGSRWERIY